MDLQEGKKTCFVIAPIGEPNSPIRLRSDQVLRHIIKPVISELGYEEPVRADHIAEPGMITEQIIQHLLDDYLVVADLTGHNSNVLYELAIRHAVRGPVVLLIAADENPPFDLSQSRAIKFDPRDMDSVADCKTGSATEPIDTSTPSGRLIFQMLDSFAEYERETLRERTRSGLHRAYRGGRHMGAVPYGYRADKHGRLEIVPEEAKVVREVVSNVAGGATLYAEAKRLNDLGVPAPGWRFVGGKRQPGSRAWSVTTVSRFVHMRVYSGTHEVRIDGGEGLIERGAPAVVEAALQERALAVLTQNKRYPNRKADRKYLLSGLVKCEACGSACTGHPATTRKGAKYHYYVCRGSRTTNFGQVRPHRPPYLNAKWLEGLVWADVRRFIADPGEVLERVREQLGGEVGAGITARKRHEDGGTEVRITYRFGPPPGGGGLQEEGGSFVGSLMNGSRS